MRLSNQHRKGGFQVHAIALGGATGADAVDQVEQDLGARFHIVEMGLAAAASGGGLGGTGSGA